MTASCSGPGDRAWRFQAMAVESFIRLLPLQRAFAPFVDEANRQNGEERHHRPESKSADLLKGHRPGKQERHFQVENDEQDGNEIVADIEAPAGVIERLKSALIGG